MAGVRRKQTQKKKRMNSTLTGRKRKSKNKKKVNIDSKAIRKTWDKSKTLKQNFKDLGLAYNVNNNMPVKNKGDGGHLNSEAMDIDKPRSSVVKELEEEASHGIKKEKHISPGETKFLWELIQDYGDNYEAMRRDKRNYYQHTAKQLRRKCTKFLNSTQDFSKYIDSQE
ncbi:nucleolar protein 16-like [Dendronephthya gigantea]|uniref:nucleolar protein 16-like n=1 Tax=Dendronephthya gigantea TaxID=151771 RepID=UPI00106CD062|nr:nucleolar protein 16-like [Dendronephthya gigantea]